MDTSRSFWETVQIVTGIVCLLLFLITLISAFSSCARESREMEIEKNILKYEICKQQGDCWRIEYVHCIEIFEKRCEEILPPEYRSQIKPTNIDQLKLYNECLTTNQHNSYCTNILYADQK